MRRRKRLPAGARLNSSKKNKCTAAQLLRYNGGVGENEGLNDLKANLPGDYEIHHVPAGGRTGKNALRRPASFPS